MHFTFVTQSVKKHQEAERILGLKLETCPLDLPELQTVDVENVVAHKARCAFEALGGKPVLIEDTGLYLEAWNGLPGALVKWFLERVDVGGMCRMLDGFPQRRAFAKTIVATFDGELKCYEGVVQGEISLEPRGKNGFGWDQIFIPVGFDRTFAEMSDAEKDGLSMRGMAFRKLAQTIHH
ncbi:MAG: non-canonical purine NTP pyrophosphatase [Blastocatellia bacterium]|nr:non-canonical purine NTP pyrophosphatase [Blastocatellia bacterium]